MIPGGPARTASSSTVASMFAARAAAHPDRFAIVYGEEKRTYATVLDRVRRLATLLSDNGVESGDRFVLLSENRAEYLEVFLAAAWIGATVACPNWRLTSEELSHCIDLVDPALTCVSSRHQGKLEDDLEHPALLSLDDDLERRLAAVEPMAGPARIDPESVLLILYTSGTTGLPKGAMISHRAQVARNMVVRAEYGFRPDDNFVAWSPMYHMGEAEYSLGTLMSGGTVFVVDGFDAERIIDIAVEHRIGWLLLMPGMVGDFADRLEERCVEPAGVTVCGVMADLVPRADLDRVTRLLNAPYANTFGATETGNPPASAGLIPIGEATENLPKTPSVFCEYRLVDPDGEDVDDGEPGELWMRGPTLFSGYWNDDEANEEAFAGGWFHMGDVFVRNDGGTIEFVDRVKYMIKSGGENIYPAEIERVLLSVEGVAETAVVRKADERWGEVPVAFVARKDDSITRDGLLDACQDRLARYKQPKDIRFIDFDDFPRSASGKVQRHELEARLSDMEPSE